VSIFNDSPRELPQPEQPTEPAQSEFWTMRYCDWQDVFNSACMALIVVGLWRSHMPHAPAPPADARLIPWWQGRFNYTYFSVSVPEEHGFWFVLCERSSQPPSREFIQQGLCVDPADGSPVAAIQFGSRWEGG